MARSTARRSLGIVIAALAILGAGLTASAQPEHVTVCHRTGSSVNPFVTIHPSANGAFHGHLKHPDDVIPPFWFQGTWHELNWDEDREVDVVDGECVSVPEEEQPPEVEPGPPVEREPPFTG